MKSPQSPAGPLSLHRLALVVNLVLFLLALVTLSVVVNYFAERGAWRVRIDATKTRAYSLSPQTADLLENLEGAWTIALVMVESDADRATRRQVDEVLTRFKQASEGISVVRIDIADPATLGQYEQVLADLRLRYADTVEAYDIAIDTGEAAFGALQTLGRRQSTTAEALAAAAPDDDPSFHSLRPRLGLLTLVGRQGDMLMDEVAKARRVSDTRPIPDYNGARSILAEALSKWSNELFELSRDLTRWAQRPGIDPAVRRTIAPLRSEFDTAARELAAAADPLRRLPPLELSVIGAELTRKEAAIIIGPDRAAVIPSHQLFPKLNLRQRDSGVAFDTRFRGEHLISAAIRSLIVEHMPLVVLVHNEPTSLARRDERQADLVGLVSNLTTSRIEVQEWIVTEGERPVPVDGQPVVWVVRPPPPGGGEAVPARQTPLLAATEAPLADGESVLLSLYPSLVRRYGQPDPWQELIEPWGLTVDTASVVLESVQTGQKTRDVLRGQAIQRFPADHAIARAVNGQQAYFGLPMPIEPLEGFEDVERHVLAEIEPEPRRWLEPDWLRALSAQEAIEEGTALDAPVPVMVAAERPHPVDVGMQRLILVGCGGWMLSNVADTVVNLSGDRVALINPGNFELAMSSVAWLAGLDDLIAAGPISQAVSRLHGVDASARRRWSWLILGAMPGACLGLGIFVWFARRR